LKDKITIDGSYGEGGGSIIRFSMAFAAMMQQPIEINNIRVKRANPGLRTQHLTGIDLINQFYGGSLQGAEVGSTSINFTPNIDFKLSEKNIKVKIETAASIGLIFQSLQLLCSNLDKEFTIELIGGGTYGLWAPSIDYIIHVTLPFLDIFGFDFDIKVAKSGFYPRGGALVFITFKPKKKIINESKILLKNRDEKPTINGISVASKELQKARVTERIAETAEKSFEKIGFETNFKMSYVNTTSIGSGMTIWTDSKTPFGASIVGQKGVSSEKIAKDIVANFYQDWSNGGIIDEYMTDQLIPFMALQETEILTGPLSEHTKTNIWICKHFFPVEFEINKVQNNLFSIQSIIN
jgi:RNA 3'-phosphate cyclase